MGWWSEDIMGGDTPLDIQSFIYDALDIKQYNEDDYETLPMSKDCFDYKKIVKYLKERDSDNYYLTGDGGNIFHQVLGVMMMEVGAPINKTLKAKMIKAAENDEWATGYEDGVIVGDEGDEHRKHKMDLFIQTLNDYDETPTKIKSIGLMDKITVGITVKDDNVSIETLRGLLLAHVEEYRHENVNSILDKLIEVARK